MFLWLKGFAGNVLTSAILFNSFLLLLTYTYPTGVLLWQTFNFAHNTLSLSQPSLTLVVVTLLPVLVVSASAATTLVLLGGSLQTLKQSKAWQTFDNLARFLTGLFLWGYSPLPPPAPTVLHFQISPLEAWFSAVAYMVHKNYFQKFRDLKFAQKIFQV